MKNAERKTGVLRGVVAVLGFFAGVAAVAGARRGNVEQSVEGEYLWAP